VDEQLLSITQARAYILEEYGVSWSGWWIRQLCIRGTLRSVRPGGGRGWLYVSKQSIDERFTTPLNPSE
jgi:hypothetical protein